MLFYKFVVGFLVLVVLWHLGVIFTKGKKLAADGYDSWTLDTKRSRIACSGWIMAIVIVLLEVMVRTSPQPYSEHPLLFGAHLFCDAVLAASFAAIMLHFTGTRSPYWHRRLVYTLFGSFAAALSTGLTLLYLLPT